MGVNVQNLISGPAVVHVAAYGAEEPADALAAMPVGWRDIGGTTGGVRRIRSQEVFNLEVDQIPGPAAAKITSVGEQYATTMAEATLENWAIACNELESAVTTEGVAPSAVTEVLELGDGDLLAEPNWLAVCVTGPGPDGKTRRVILRKVLSTESIESTSEKAGQTGIPVTWTAYRVSDSIKRVRMMDTTPATA